MIVWQSEVNQTLYHPILRMNQCSLIRWNYIRSPRRGKLLWKNNSFMAYLGYLWRKIHLEDLLAKTQTNRGKKEVAPTIRILWRVGWISFLPSRPLSYSWWCVEKVSNDAFSVVNLYYLKWNGLFFAETF